MEEEFELVKMPFLLYPIVLPNLLILQGYLFSISSLFFEE
jgi:hypothetical protein